MSASPHLPVQVIIPARKNSKRFPKKNKALLGGIPLVAHSIQYALDEGISKDQIWVNSDDPEILEIAKGYDVKLYPRVEGLAEDTTSTAAVLEDQLNFFKKNLIPCEAIVLLQVTNPFRPKGKLVQWITELLGSDRSSLCSFSPLNKKFGRIKKGQFQPVNYQPGQRMQDLEALYYENGCIYITKATLIADSKVIGKDAIPIVMEDILYTVDIDEKFDLELAEALLLLRKEKIQ